MVLPSLSSQIFSPGLLKSIEQDIKRHERELPEETPAKDNGGTLSLNKGEGARGLREAFQGQCRLRRKPLKSFLTPLFLSHFNLLGQFVFKI